MQTQMHDPVLLDEVIFYLTQNIAPLKNEVCIIDATLGFAGHASEFVKRGIFTVGIDTDETSLEHAEKVLRRASLHQGSGRQACPVPHHPMRDPYKLIHANFKDIDSIVLKNDIPKVYGVLIDLGVSTWQLTSLSRGLSFQNQNAPLDMRLDTKYSQVKGSDLLNLLDHKQLTELFGKVMDYQSTRHLIQSITRARQHKQFQTVGDFLSIIPDSKTHTNKLHFATLPFMALRMAVNSELENIREVLPKAFSVLEKGGRLAIISFHSKEDALVKEFMREMDQTGAGKLITKKIVVPTDEEIKRNPRSRSAKLRVIEKI